MMLLTVTSLMKSYGTEPDTIQILDGVTASVASGESVALTGESGSGKSTFLHIIAGLEPADGGSVVLAGHEITVLDDPSRAELRRGTVGLVFQQFNLIPSLTVAANIDFQARLAGKLDTS